MRRLLPIIILASLLLTSERNLRAQWAPVQGFLVGTVTAMSDGPWEQLYGILNGRLYEYNGPGWHVLNTPFSDARNLGWDGQHFFVGTYNHGIFKSTDMGSTWVDLSPQMPSKGIVSMVVPWTNIIIAGSGDKGILLSNDDGASWKQITDGIPYSSIRALFLGQQGDVYACSGIDVFRSTDEGQSWKMLKEGWDITVTRSIATNSKYLFVGTGDEGVFRSSDKGVSWQGVSIGFVDSNIHVLYTSGDTLLAGTDSGLYLSTNSGDTWTKRNLNSLHPDAAVYAIYLENSRLYLSCEDGVFGSQDRGMSWSPSSNGLTMNKWGVNCLTTVGSNFIAGTKGAFYSTDHGASWQRSQGMDSVIVSTLLTSGSDVFAGGDSGGVFLSTDGGATFHQRNVGLATDAFLLDSFNHSGYRYHRSVNILVKTGQYIFASTGSTATNDKPPGDSILFVSSDYGNTWSEVTFNSFIAPFGTDYLYEIIEMEILGTDLVVTNIRGGNNIMRTTDHGTTWTEVERDPNQRDSTIGVLVTCGTKLLNLGNRTWSSTDFGAHWVPAPNSIGETQPYYYSYQSIGQNIFELSSIDHAHVSTDAGQSWTDISDGLHGSYNQPERQHFAIGDGYAYVFTNYGIFKRPVAELHLSTLVRPNAGTLVTQALAIDFGQHHYSTDSSIEITMTNPTANKVEITSADIFGPNHSDFTLSNSRQASFPLDSLAAGDSIRFTVRYVPSAPAHTSEASLVVRFDYDSVVTLSLSAASVGAAAVSSPQEESDLSISPNPTESIIEVRSTGGDISAVSVADVLGRIVFQESKLRSPSVSINLASLPAGSYVVKVAGASGTTLRKIEKR